ncbi:MAG TPA: tripartite tricarboxylate transporter permease [Burkholderiales bacterium]|jgi:putative tricarboxylic transport membrane protein|nr:tripartite tricarboxylate transporter permease [Burkholderiales bacterium]
MAILSQLIAGFGHVFTPVNLAMLAIGLVLGLLVAVLPGLTLVMGVVLALPFTYAMDVTPAIILLTAMYVTGTYGGAFTAILFRVPGEPIDVPLLWDGYSMARRGMAAKALGWTLLAAFTGGLLSACVMVAFAEPVARVALELSTPEYFAIIFFGLTSVVSLGGGSVANALISLCLGLLVSTVGVDDTYGSERFVFGVPILADGIEYLLVMVGAYGIGEVFTRLYEGYGQASAAGTGKLSTELPRWREIATVKATLARSSLIGVLVGVVPGAGATIASFVSYGAEGQYGRRRGEMGTGIPEGIVAPQTAATSSVGGAMIPLLTMGIPGSGATAIILGAFLLHGVQPGPQIFTNPEQAQMAYTVFASLFLGVIGMCLLGYFAIKLLVRVLDFPEAIVSAFVVMFCFIGAFAARNNLTDLYVIAAFGVIGFLFERARFPIAPLVLGSILGPLAENTFMTTMISFDNDWTVFFTRPVSGTVLALALVALLLPVVRQLRGRKITP